MTKKVWVKPKVKLLVPGSAEAPVEPHFVSAVQSLTETTGEPSVTTPKTPREGDGHEFALVPY